MHTCMIVLLLAVGTGYPQTINAALKQHEKAFKINKIKRTGEDLGRGGVLRFPETSQVYLSIQDLDLQWYKSSDQNTLIEQSITLIGTVTFHFLIAVSS